MTKHTSRIAPIKIWISSLIVIYAGLITFGVSNSSLSFLSIDGASRPGLVFNSPQPVRSDEFLRSTPLALGELKGGSGVSKFDSQNSPIILEIRDGYANKIFTWTSPRYLFASGAKTFLNDESAFSAICWFPIFLLLVFLPLFLLKLGVTAEISILISVMVLLSTSSNWWSLWPAAILTWPIVGSYLAVTGLEKITLNPGKKGFFFGLFSILIGICFLLQSAFEYAPWAIPLNLFVLMLTLGYIKENSVLLKSGKRFLASFIVVLGLLLAVKIAVNRSAFSITLETVYPGARRFVSGGSGLEYLSGNLSWALQRQLPITSNQSELANSGLELLLLIFSFMPLVYLFRKTLGKNLALMYGALVLIPFFLWIIAPWPSSLVDLNPLRFISPDRIAQIIGLPSIVLFGLFATLFRKSHFQDGILERQIKRGLVCIALIPIFVLVIDSNKGFATLFNEGVIPPKYVWFGALFAVFSIYVALIAKNVWVAFTPLLMISFLNVYAVNPIVIGLGDLRNSSSAQLVNQLVESDQQLWASDNFWVDALLMSNGANLASGQQLSGPNAKAYELLDPKNEFIESWNRGASYVSFIWLDKGDTEISSPSADQIRIAIDPCSSDVSSLEIKWIVSSRPLSNDCSTFRGDVIWMGTTFYVYERI